MYQYDVDIEQEIDLRNEYLLVVKEILAAEKVEIWIGDTVQDIFFATVILHLLARDEIDTSNFFIRTFDNEKVKWGLGVIRVEELGTLYMSSTAKPVDTRLYADVWKAISQGTGSEIDGFIAGHDSSNPIVRALSAYLLRLPEFNGGLGSIERALLGAGTLEMKSSAYTVGAAMALGDPANDNVGDLVLFQKLVELSEVSPNPWFKLEGDTRNMRSCSAQITDSGKQARTTYSVKLL